MYLSSQEVIRMDDLRPSAAVYVSVAVQRGNGWAWERVGGGKPMAEEPVYSRAEICAVLKSYGRVVSWLMSRQHQGRFRLELQGLTTDLIVGLHTYTPDASGKPVANGDPWVYLPPFEELPEYVQRGYTEGRYAACCEEKRLAASTRTALPVWELRLGVPGPQEALYAPLALAE